MPPFRSVKNKGKVRWSKLYSFSCFRPQSNDDPILQQYGGPGFSRTIFCNQSYFHKKYGSRSYPNNYVSTTKYNFVTFFPKALFEQFRRVANLYFLLSAILSVTPVAPFSRGSVIAPLVFVVGISMTKEALEDWHRFVQDIHVNSRLVKVHIGNGAFVRKPWKELHVGDVVKIEKDQYFPSDLLLLSSSFDDGLCYVDTMNLDGETNLKYKRCLEVTLDLDSDMEFKDFKATIRCEDPNPNLYSITGNLEYVNSVHALDSCQVLLRDSKLRNTEYIYGVVIFSGHETKAIQNSTRSPSKRSRIEKKMDYIIYLLFSTLLLLSLFSASGTVVFVKFKLKHCWYLKPDRDPFFNISNPGLSGLLQLIRTLIMYGYLIPISLYVSIEMVKVLQAVLINTDIAMFDEETCKSTKARTSNLNEELGQVDIILSDKTGTLTCNQMEFRKCSIAGVSYGGEVNEVDIAASKRMNIDILKFEEKSHDLDAELEKYVFNFDKPDNPNDICMVAESSKLLQRPAAIKGFNFTDDRLMHMNWMKKPYVSHITMFLKVLALCHTGIPIEQDTMGKFKYEAESPEEVAFLIAAQEFGFAFCQRTQSCIVVKELEVERQYSLLNLLEFSSLRKRMSVIVRDENDQIFLLSKGADSVIYDRLGEDGKHYCEATRGHLSDYAEDGLRTLAIAYRRIESDYYEKWNSIFTEAKTTVGPDRDELLASASEMIEKDLILLGAVAIEDKLQKGVPECIDRLAQAGIKIWLLTGDKKETAINIGFSCSLLRHDMKQFHIGIESKLSCKNVMKEEIIVQIHTASKVISRCQDGMMPFALIIDGEAIELALHSDVRNSFISLSVNCASVICCRVSPKQKALITRLVKKYTGMTTLAIGDGANDVGMIQEADIGVGISGMEGMQAVMASDFSLPKFHMLGRLLIVHGHWCYKRIAKMVLYFVYKNIAFGMTLFYYELYTSFSGEVLYDDWYMTLFNVVLTSLPVISLGVFDQDVSAEVCLQFPALYQQGQKNLFFSWTRIIGWIFNALFTSLGTFILNIYIFSSTAFQNNGQVADAAQLGTIMFSCIICTVNCQIALIISHFTWIQHLFIWGSICLWYLFLMIYGSLPVSLSKKGFRHLSEALGPSSKYWLTTLFIVVVCILPYFVLISIQRWFYPMDDHVIQEMKYCNKDATDRPMWVREQKNSNGKIHVGFTSRVDAKVKYWREHFHEKKENTST